MQARKGFSLIEVMVALAVLAVAMMGAQSLASTMIRTVTSANAQMTAGQLVDDRIDLIRTDPDFPNLANYAGTETTIPGWSTYTRTTQIVRTQATNNGRLLDYYTVTVTVNGTPLRVPVSRTVIIGAT
jgi:prepilin-type N-terminal cleavage/methylation domain-containing protein